jgi:hypothetical protein
MTTPTQATQICGRDQSHDPPPYSWLGALGGVSYLVALVTLRLRG